MDLNQRALDILNTLLQEHEKNFTLHELAQKYRVSERSVRYDVESIDYFLKINSLPKLKRDVRVEIGLDNSLVTESKSKEKLTHIVNNFSPYNPKERMDIIYMELLLKKEHVTIDYLTERLDVSRSSINADIRRLKKELSESGILISNVSDRGYVIGGNEMEVRKRALNISASDAMPGKYQLFDDYTYEYFSSLVEKVEYETGKTYSGSSFQLLVNSLIIMFFRVKALYYLKAKRKTDTNLKNSREYSVLKEIRAELEAKFDVDVPEDEIVFQVNLFLESNLIKANDYLDENWIDLHLLINEFIEDISLKMNVELKNDQELFEALVLHLGPAFQRIKNKVYLQNEMLTTIQESYSDIYNTVSNSLTALTDNKQIFITSDEIGYVTLHIASSLEKMSNIYLNVLLVCESGLGTSKLLETRIKKYLPFKIVGTIPVRKLTYNLVEQNDIKLIISTIQINEEFSVPIVKVTPLLQEKEIKMLRNFGFDYSSNTKPIKKQSYLETENNKEEFIPMLNDLLIKETIATDVKANDWEEAVTRGGELLLNNGYIEEEYIDAMINSVKELGPYIVISPNIAMPHASPGKGTNEIGISLITLKEPVNFGHEENDPVKVVVCLAAVDHSSHLNALSTLVQFLNNKDFLDLLKNHPTAERIISYINQEEKNGLPE